MFNHEPTKVTFLAANGAIKIGSKPMIFRENFLHLTNMLFKQEFLRKL